TPNTASRTVAFRVSDGSADSDPSTKTIDVVAVNSRPVNTVPAVQVVDGDGSLVFSTGNGNPVSVSDVDAGGGIIEVRLTAGNGLITHAGTTGLTFLAGDGTDDGTVVFEGTIADIN